MTEPVRRPFLKQSLRALALLTPPAWATAPARLPARADSPRVGTDPLFIATGLTARWQRAMKQDLGWAARWAAMGTPMVLDQLEQGQIDAGLFLSHPRADHLEQQGLIFNRQTIARTDVLLLGPADDLAGIRGETDPGRALRQILAACRAGAAAWQPLEAGSALAALADTLSQGQASQILTARPPQPAAAQTAYRLVTRAQWLTQPGQGTPLKVWLAGPPALSLNAQIACAYRSRHPGAKLLVNWLQWPLAQGAVKAGAPGWQPLKG